MPTLLTRRTEAALRIEICKFITNTKLQFYLKLQSLLVFPKPEFALTLRALAVIDHIFVSLLHLVFRTVFQIQISHLFSAF